MSDQLTARELENSPSIEDLDRQLAADEAARSQPQEEVKETPKQSRAPVQEEKVEHEETKEETEEPVKKEETEDEIQKRLNRAGYEAREAKRQARALQDELARLRGQAAPLTQDQEVERQINERAAQMAAMQAYNKQADDIYHAGVAKYSDFHHVIETFNKELGQIPVPLVEAAIDTGDAPKVIHYLGSNLDEAERIMALSPTKMGVALAKIAAKDVVQKPAVVQSKAPPPIKPIAGGAKAAPSPENMSMDEFVRWQDKHDAERRKSKW